MSGEMAKMVEVHCWSSRPEDCSNRTRLPSLLISFRIGELIQNHDVISGSEQDVDGSRKS